MTQGRTILVTGATGAQGGAVARMLLDDGWTVRALVRDPHRQAARDLQALGADLVLGDLDDPESLRAAARGAHGVFSVQPDLADPRPGIEVRRGENVAEAAAAAGVEHLVYSSVGGADRKSGVPHFETKARIEASVAALGIPATVLRPTFFMENWTRLVAAGGRERVGAIALAPDTSLQMIAVADIGRIAAEAFARPDEFAGVRLEIAGDELTIRQVAEAFTRIDGVPTRIRHQSVEEVRPHSPELAEMFGWLDEHGYRADVPALRERFPELLSFDAWLRGNW
ncbi:NmrA/HSCARG family protein [Streptomyces tritici]|uniref:NmrA/HSCARG family protein n=1 Tax=Streptomyces tritici TaxID=2054410 RepID=UPI003AF0CB94